MSVPKNLRSQGKLIVQTKAYDFASFTHQICSNENVFLKRNRWCSTTKIVESADEIAINVEIANNVSVRGHKPEQVEKRTFYQNKAIEATIKIECLMEIAYRDNNRGEKHISDDKIENWIGLLLELRSLIRKWRDSADRGQSL